MKFSKRKSIDTQYKEDDYIRVPIKYNMGVDYIINMLAEGNLNSQKILLRIKQIFNDWAALYTILEDKNIRGNQICYALMACNGNLSLLRKMLVSDKKNELSLTINILSVLNDDVMNDFLPMFLNSGSWRKDYLKRHKAISGGAIYMREKSREPNKELYLMDDEVRNIVNNIVLSVKRDTLKKCNTMQLLVDEIYK